MRRYSHLLRYTFLLLLFLLSLGVPKSICQQKANTNPEKTNAAEAKTSTTKNSKENKTSQTISVNKEIPDSTLNKEIQESNEDLLLNLLLPPIEEFFESAKNNPTLSFYRSRTAEETYALRTINNSWLNYIRLTGGYQYGSMGVISTIDASNSLLYQNTSNHQSYYNIGVSIVLPLETFIDLGNKSKKQKQAILQTELETERYYNEQKLLISEAYTNAIRAFNLIRVRSEALQLAEAQYRISVDDFVENKISASDLSRMKNIHSSAKGDYELIRAELVNALLRLEILSGYKIFETHNSTQK